MVYSSALDAFHPAHFALSPEAQSKTRFHRYHRVKLIDDLLVFSAAEPDNQDENCADVVAIPCLELITLESQGSSTLVSTTRVSLSLEIPLNRQNPLFSLDFMVPIRSTLTIAPAHIRQFYSASSTMILSNARQVELPNGTLPASLRRILHHQYEDHLLTSNLPRQSNGSISLPYHLTLRQYEVAQLLIEGHTNQQISELLHIAPSTVMSHVKQIFLKLGIHRRSEVAQLESIQSRHPEPSKQSAAQSSIDYQSFDLTPREVEIIQLVVRGFTNNEIADALHISKNTVPTHVKNIFKKVGVHRRSELICKLRLNAD